MSIALSKIIEAEGYWNYIVKGSLSIDFPPEAKLKDRYFWSYDLGFKYAAAHAWLLPLHLPHSILPSNSNHYRTGTRNGCRTTL
jgi:hypothetical protein